MGTWLIDGAMRESGKETDIAIIAPTREAAIADAQSRGILVSKVRQIDSTGSSDNTNDQSDAVPAAADQPPEYSDIVRGAKVMRVFGDVLAAFGWLGLICFCVVLLMFLLTPYDHHPPAPSDIADCFVFALVCFIWSALWRMIGSLAIAVRDIARNSFGR